MEEPEQGQETFLEPVYLNEKMVLNCAAYLFKGYSLEADTRNQLQTDRTKSLEAGLTFLQRLISIGGESQSKESQIAENRSARRYTVGGLHMSLVDELHHRNMLKAIAPETLLKDLEDASSYIEMLAILQPIQFYELLDTLRISGPIVGEVLESFVIPLYQARRKQELAMQGTQMLSHTVGTKVKSQQGHSRNQKQTPNINQHDDNYQLVLKNIKNYVEAVGSVLKYLEDDYRRSKQIEMVMWSPGQESRPYGVVDLDLADYEPSELRAKLSGGTFRIVGKITRVVNKGESINLLQKSALYSVLSIFNKLIEVQGETDSLTQYRQGLNAARGVIERFGLLEVHGPAVRVAAMSVCI